MLDEEPVALPTGQVRRRAMGALAGGGAGSATGQDEHRDDEQSFHSLATSTPHYTGREGPVPLVVFCE